MNVTTTLKIELCNYNFQILEQRVCDGKRLMFTILYIKSKIKTVPFQEARIVHRQEVLAGVALYITHL